MSTISGTGNGAKGSEDLIATAKNREKELVEKHKEDVSSLRAAHQEEIQRLKEAQQQSEQRSEERHASAMTAKDVQYQREIKNLRELYAKRKTSDT